MSRFNNLFHSRFLYLGILIIIIFIVWISKQNDKNIEALNLNLNEIEKKIEDINANYLKSVASLRKINSQIDDTINKQTKLEPSYENDTDSRIDELFYMLNDSVGIFNYYDKRRKKSEEKLDSILHVNDSLMMREGNRKSSEKCKNLYRTDSTLTLSMYDYSSGNGWDTCHSLIYKGKVSITLCMDSSLDNIFRSTISIKGVNIDRLNNCNGLIISTNFFCPDSFETIHKVLINDTIYLGFRSLYTKSRSSCQAPYVYIYMSGILKKNLIEGVLIFRKQVEDPFEIFSKYFLKTPEYPINFKLNSFNSKIQLTHQ